MSLNQRTVHACAFLPTLSLFYAFFDSRAWDRQRSTCNKYAQAVFSVYSTFVDPMAYDFANLMELFAGPQSGLSMHAWITYKCSTIGRSFVWQAQQMYEKAWSKGVGAVIEELQHS